MKSFSPWAVATIALWKSAPMLPTIETIYYVIMSYVLTVLAPLFRPDEYEAPRGKFYPQTKLNYYIIITIIVIVLAIF